MSDSKEEGRLCANGCGFYDSEDNHGLCPNCYDNYLMEKVTTMLASTNDTKPKSVVEDANRARQTPTMTSNAGMSAVPDWGSQRSHLPMLSVPSPSKVAATKVQTRCTLCKKHVGLLGFPCLHCEDVFCGSHRHTEDHACSVNLRRISRRALARRNPVIKADKLGFRA
ncbi:hypothetical protein MLD38_003158 [Melastoma candidum]|uniref:Uncharacterized protein n=1 Tax=Melastoma candidum TaxID=119954 RepID=A0ACB9S321_9MYRT|nr:hypothetical protein MLD38_003158 [Melastoma candidum]